MRAASRAKLELGPKKVFSYFTRTVYLSFLNVVMNNYKQVERKNTYIRIELEKLGVSDMKIDEILGRKKDEKYNTGMMKDFWVNSSYKTEEKRKAEA